MQENVIKTNIQDKKQPPNKNKGSYLSIAVRALGILIIIALIGVFVSYRTYDSVIQEPLSDSTEVVQFEIPEGSTPDSIIEEMIRVGILEKSDTLFLKIYLRLNDLGSTIQAGEYLIPKDLNMIELIETLQNGQIRSVWVTFPEGLRADEYAEILASAFTDIETTEFNEQTFMDLVNNQIFIDSLDLNIETSSLEGFLFPDKYLLPETITEKEVLITLVENFKSKVSITDYEDLIIASLLEREGRTSEERHMIADIIQRRLEEGWFLNIDATLLYYYQDWTREISIEDIETDHEYNTYLRLGVPPTPICNPGASSIDSAINPTPNNYYYYIHDKNGNIHYAKTLEEHNANVIKYLQ